MQLPILKTFKLYEPIPDNPGTNFDFKGVYVDAAGSSHNVTVFETEYFVKNIIQLYRSRLITLPDEQTEAHFKALFDSWVNSRKELYLKQAYAYTLKYNPIENYTSVEQMIDDETVHVKGASSKDDYHNTDTMTITPYTKETTETTPYTKETTETTPYTKETTETTPYTSETTTTKPTDTTTSSKKAFDSSNWSEVDKTSRGGQIEEKLEKVGTEKVEFSKTGTEKVEFSKTGKEKVELTKTGNEIHAMVHTGYVDHTTDGSDTDTRNYTLEKHGNIGVKTAAEMLQAEYDGLMQDLAYRALAEFVDRYSYMCEEVG